MKTIEFEAGKMELVQAIANISNPELLAKARKALFRVIHASAKKEEEEELMNGGIPALQFTKEELIAHIDKSLQDIAEGRTHTSTEVHRKMEEKYPFLCK